MGLLVVTQIAKRMDNVPDKMGALIAAGTSICGVTAITALSPAIKASPRETAVAVANVVCFGTFGMMVYPYLAHAVFPSSESVGMFLGLAIHDTSQVIGSAMTYKEVYDDEVALQVAAVTKLTRNLFLAGVIPGLSWYYGSREGGGASAPKAGVADEAKPSVMSGLATFQKHVPLFVVAFVGASMLRSFGDYSAASTGLAFYALSPETYAATLGFVGGTASKCLLGTAMASVGLGTSASSLRGIGWQPFALGMTGAVVVGVTGGAGALFLVG